ncbi:uracil phosphoribosyltransferase [Flavobacterium sp.]|uniref:DUF6341 family protein n=1 Tax=Flavobacterium sp. TaxID=239 RepID=UPI002602289C|nr:uracil phosphoribosyltransferase [Flavobacterium sp.]MDD3004351.1 uracil phosphoribosyltransferase [Flavobacterium sp.]
MTAFFNGIQALFVDFLFVPLDFLRSLELRNWFGANILNWVFMLICAVAIVYWIMQLREHKANNDEFQDTTAHSFLK